MVSEIVTLASHNNVLKLKSELCAHVEKEHIVSLNHKTERTITLPFKVICIRTGPTGK